MLLQCAFDNWFALVIGILCVWRITSLICYEAGPFDIIIKLRKAMYKLGLGKVVECFHCLGYWVAIVIALFMFEPGITTIFVVFAIAGGASVIERSIS